MTPLMNQPPRLRRAPREAAMTREQVLSASPVQLLNMLFDRLMLDLERGRVALEGHQWDEAHKQLIHAQEILTELSSTLRTDTWDQSRNLLGLYEYCSVAISRGNVGRNPQPIADAVRLLTPIRSAWSESARQPEVIALTRTA